MSDPEQGGTCAEERDALREKIFEIEDRLDALEDCDHEECNTEAPLDQLLRNGVPPNEAARLSGLSYGYVKGYLRGRQGRGNT